MNPCEQPLTSIFIFFLQHRISFRVTIFREIHSDKLPDDCRQEKMKQMMAEVLGKVESIRDCVAEPHTCSGEL